MTHDADAGGTATGSRTAHAAGTNATAFTALVAGAIAMGCSPMFVRLADVGPFASAFWRAFLALPVLAVWAAVEARRQPQRASGGIDVAVVLAGLFFAGDLVFWHLAILNTSIANATFLATIAPVWVVLGSRFFLGEPVAGRVVGGLALCLLGGAALIGASAQFTPEKLIGDIYALITSMFFGAYFLAIRAASRRLPPGRITFQSTAVTAAALLVVALTLDNGMIPASAGGLAALLALALVSQVAGQGLLAFALGRLPAAFSSLVIFLEAVFAPFAAWVVFNEGVTGPQLFGGALILCGIVIARPKRQRRDTPPAPVPAE